METAGQTGTDQPAPLELNVRSLRGAPVAVGDDGRLILPILDGDVVRLHLVADGNHMATRAGLRQLWDAIALLQYEVMSQQLADERAAREAAKEITTTTSEAYVDADGSVAARLAL